MDRTREHLENKSSRMDAGSPGRPGSAAERLTSEQSIQVWTQSASELLDVSRDEENAFIKRNIKQCLRPVAPVLSPGKTQHDSVKSEAGVYCR